MNTLGFDLATRSAWAKVAIREHKGPEEPEYVVLHWGVMDMHGHDYVPTLLHAFYRSLKMPLAYVGADTIIAVEQVPASWRGVKQIALQQQMYGVFYLSLQMSEPEIPIYPFSPSEWQMALLGIRSNTKLLKALSIEQAKLRAGFVTKDKDLADAVNIGIWGLIKARQAAAIGANV